MPLYAFNGTWNSEKTEDLQTSVRESDANTNVIRFRDAYQDPSIFYLNGVGTRLSWIGKAVGGAFGAGGFTRIEEALAHLRQHVREYGATPVDIVGFSRGAALALAFANRVYKDRTLKGPSGQPPHIRFLGLFDVVGAFGIPVNLGPFRFQEYNVGFELTLPPNVEHCYHAMALDERRQAFRVTRVTGAYEVWFRGAHSDIGGGNNNIGLNAIAGTWMLRKAYACGLPIRQDHLLSMAGLAAPSTAPQWASHDPVKNEFRALLADDRVHHTVTIPSAHRDCNDPPASCAREDAVAEATARRCALFEGN